MLIFKVLSDCFYIKLHVPVIYLTFSNHSCNVIIVFEQSKIVAAIKWLVLISETERQILLHSSRTCLMIEGSR